MRGFLKQAIGMTLMGGGLAFVAGTTTYYLLTEEIDPNLLGAFAMLCSNVTSAAAKGACVTLSDSTSTVKIIRAMSLVCVGIGGVAFIGGLTVFIRGCVQSQKQTEDPIQDEMARRLF